MACFPAKFGLGCGSDVSMNPIQELTISPPARSISASSPSSSARLVSLPLCLFQRSLLSVCLKHVRGWLGSVNIHLGHRAAQAAAAVQKKQPAQAGQLMRGLEQSAG